MTTEKLYRATIRLEFDIAFLLPDGLTPERIEERLMEYAKLEFENSVSLDDAKMSFWDMCENELPNCWDNWCLVYGPDEEVTLRQAKQRVGLLRYEDLKE
jgi:hypothetical protein